MSDNGETALTALSEKNHVAKGDLVVTSGGVFPENIVIGTVREIQFDAFSADRLAVIQTAVDIRRLTHAAVMLPKDKTDG